MDGHIVKILKADYITHDVRRFMIERPHGYNFIPGQATDVSINRAGWIDQLRPFTFTCLSEADYLEFMIKIYNDHTGVTNALGQINPGEELILHDVFGVIQYKGPGVFIAGGAGITPFISILRTLKRDGLLNGNMLIFSNKTKADVILEKELKTMKKLGFINVITREQVAGVVRGRIDRMFLVNTISDFEGNFYICGPDDFVQSITSHLIDLGAVPDAVVFER